MGKKVLEKEGAKLLSLARETIFSQLESRPASNSPDENVAEASVLNERQGTFVTLHKKSGELRGCIGNIQPYKSVLESVRDNAGHAAFHDTRFAPLGREELDDIVIEVSILTKPEPLDYADAQSLLAKLRPGIDGVIIKKGSCQATFLPQVWEQLAEKEAFLTQLCIKAGLAPDAWQTGDLEIQTYEVQVFSE